MRMFNKRVTNKGVNNNMYAMNNNPIVREHKRNVEILQGVLLIVGFGMVNILKNMHNLNRYHQHISLGMFSNLSIVKVYNLKAIQLQVLYNYLLFNSHIK